MFSEAELAAITPPAGVTNLFPYGFVVRNKNTNVNRTLPSAAADANQYDGVLTVAYRIPLQDTKANDVFTLTFQAVAVEDTETRLTESIEESQDTGAVRRLRDRATSLGATMVTVLDGSPVVDPAVSDYPGQRQICGTRTAGIPAIFDPAGAPCSRADFAATCTPEPTSRWPPTPAWPASTTPSPSCVRRSLSTARSTRGSC